MDFWTTFFSVGLGSGFALGITKFGFDWFRDRRDRSGKQKHTALRLASILEGFAIKCARNVSSHQTFVEHDGNAGKALGAILPPVFPEAMAYDLLSADLVDAIFDFPQRCEMADEAADFWWDVVGDQDAYAEALEENTVEVGVLALQISRKIRSEYGLNTRDLTFGGWSIDDFFEKQLKGIRERKAKQQARDAEV